LTPAEKNNLSLSIKSGLGLLDMSYSKSESTFFPFQTSPTKKDTATVLMGSKSLTLPTARVSVVSNASVTPILKNKNRVLAGYKFLGAGKVGFQLLQETYQLSLSGDSISYGTLWTPLLETLARPERHASKIGIATLFPLYTNEPIDIEVISSNEEVTLRADSSDLPLRENVAVDNVWHTRAWEDQPGWHTLQSNDGDSLHFYVSKPDEWKSLYLVNQQQANKLFKSNKAASEEIEIRKEISPLIFYMMFLLTAGFLWLAPKLP
jgi:hypothetical protein